MRLFFALWPAPETAGALAHWAQRMQRTAGGRATRAGAIHLTLAFLGEVEPRRLQDAVTAARTVNGAAHALPLEEARYWEHNRVVWAGPREVPAPLAALAARLREALARAGFVLEARSFQAHVTLVRKARPPGSLPALPAVDWPIGEFVLLRSELSCEGSSYQVLERFPLGG